jgi:hypothetical protein
MAEKFWEDRDPMYMTKDEMTNLSEEDQVLFSTPDSMAFDLMNEGGESMDLFNQEVDLSDQIINNMPENASLNTVILTLDTMIDDPRWPFGHPAEHAGLEIDPNTILKTTVNKILNSGTLSEKYEDLLDELNQKAGELEEGMGETVSEAGIMDGGYEDHWVGDVQAATFGGMNPLMREEVSFDPESFDYLDHILGTEIASFAKSIRFDILPEGQTEDTRYEGY